MRVPGGSALVLLAVIAAGFIAQREERRDIANAIEEALCRKSIGEACPP
ncbi:MAG: hypothetical protein J0H06_05070 [Actinobacteria bacterium]|nr:hypothetical protein [Actinomycetota bacterium]